METALVLVLSVTFLAMFFLGVVVGILTKGININITKKEPVPVPQEEVIYNPSTANELPDEIKNYYDQNKGLNNF